MLLLLFLLLLGVLPSSGIIIIPRRYRPVSSSSSRGLFREIVRRRVFSLRSIGVYHLFFFVGIGGRLSMKCLLTLFSSRGSLQMSRREFSLFCPRLEQKKKTKTTSGCLTTEEHAQTTSTFCSSLSVCVCRPCVFVLFYDALTLTLFFAASFEHKSDERHTVVFRVSI